MPRTATEGKNMNETADRVRIVNVEVLSDDWYVLKKTTLDRKSVV